MTDWIDWPGGECPVAADAVVEVRYRDESAELDYAANLGWTNWAWRASNIVAYRVLPTIADLAERDAEIERLNAALSKYEQDDARYLADIDRLRAELAVAREAMQPMTEKQVENLLWVAEWPEVLLSDFVRAKLRFLIRSTERHHAIRAAIQGKA